MAKNESIGVDRERETYIMPMRYNITMDEMVPVTQKWVKDVERYFIAFGKARAEARRAITFDEGMTLPETRALRDFLEAWKPEFEQRTGA